MPWTGNKKRVAAVAVAAGLALTVGTGTAVAEELDQLIVSSDTTAAVLSEEAIVVEDDSVVSADADGAAASDAPTDSEDQGGVGTESSTDSFGSGDTATDSGSDTQNENGSGSDEGSEDADSAKQGDGTESSADSGAKDQDADSASDPVGKDSVEMATNSAHPENGWWTNPATGELEYYVDGVLTTPDRVFYTDVNGDKYWYENGVMREEHAFYDPATDKWYWADLGGKCARNKDTYIPLNDAAEAGDWRNNGNGKWVRVADDFSLVKGENYSVSRDDSQWHWWYFDACTGQMLKNFVYVASYDKWCYYDDTFGWMVYGEQYRMSKDNTSAGYHWYYFDDHTGATTYGYRWIADPSDAYYGGKTCYYDTTMGWMLYDWQVINGVWNYFDTSTGRQCSSTNAAHDACLWLNWAGSNSGATNDMYVMVDKGRLRTSVFRKVNGTWVPMQDYLCSVASGSGNHGNGTIEGFWHLGLLTNDERGITNGSVYDHSSSGYGAQIDNFVNSGSSGITWSGPAIGKVADDRFANTSYRYHYLEDQGIHSVVHTGGDEDSQLGQRNTDGCVRLSTINAKWIFDWVPMYTTIRIYSDVRY